MPRGRPKTDNPRKEAVVTNLNTDELAMLDAVAGATPRSAFLRRLLHLVAAPVYDDALTEHLVIRLSPSDLDRIRQVREPMQSEREYVLGLIRADARRAAAITPEPSKHPPWRPPTA